MSLKFPVSFYPPQKYQLLISSSLSQALPQLRSKRPSPQKARIRKLPTVTTMKKPRERMTLKMKMPMRQQRLVVLPRQLLRLRVVMFPRSPTWLRSRTMTKSNPSGITLACHPLASHLK